LQTAPPVLSIFSQRQTATLLLNFLQLHLRICSFCRDRKPPHGVDTRRLSKRKAYEEQPLSGSGERGKEKQFQTSSTSTPVPVPPVEGRKTANSSAIASVPASIQDMTSLIEDFTDVTAESPAAKRDVNAKRRNFVEETSTITTPGNTPRTSARARSEASIVRPKSSVRATAKQSAARKKSTKTKPELVTPAEFARRLQEQAANPPPLLQTSDPGSRKSSAKLPVKAVQPPQYLKGWVIFYTGGDLTYASARTRGCMNYVRILLVTYFRT